MGATVIDGKALAAATKAEAAEKVRELKSRGINPCLAVILVGENPASQVYVRGKINDCAQCGIESRSINLPADTTQDALLAEVKKLADDSAVHGILVQLPLPAQIDEKAVIDAIPPEKDVDGFSPVNVGRMQIGEPCYLPCTPAGCIRMIESTGTDIAGKNAVVIGRSNIVGKPAALLLLAKNATVTICHSRTKNLKEVCAAADILVAAVGREGFVTGDMVKPGAVVIDVGINRGADGKLHGDVNFAEAAEKAAYITPVPGGVGPTDPRHAHAEHSGGGRAAGPLIKASPPWGKLSAKRTDEGQPCHCSPLMGYNRRLAPHPALRGHFPPPGGKAKEILKF